MKASKLKEEKSKANYSKGIIFFLIDTLTDMIYNALTNGFFSKIFTSYSALQNSFDNGFFSEIYSKSSKIRTYGRNVKKYLSKNVENSFLVSKILDFIMSLVCLPLRSYGNMFFSFGIYTVIIYFLRLFLPIIETADVSFAIIGVILALVSIPMMLSRDNLAMAVGKSMGPGALFNRMFGFREENFRKHTDMSRWKSNALTIMGIAFGLLTLIIHPLTVLSFIAIFAIISLIFCFPEIGIVLTLFLLPFFSLLKNPSISLGILTLIVFISYLTKIVKGKRIIKFGLVDYAVLLFSIVIFFSGTITAGGKDALNEVLLSCTLLLGYFLASNLIRTNKWVKRCVYSLISSATIISMIGIAQYITGAFSQENWLDTSYFFDIKGRVTSLFDNPNVLAVYLVIVLPFVLYALTRAKNGSDKLLFTISFVTIATCIILTWSRGAWISAFFCIIAFLLMYNKRSTRPMAIFAIFTPLLAFFIPQSVIRRITSIGDMSDSSTLYRVFTWRGTVRGISEHLISGVGYGNSAFREMYPQYAYAGIEAAQHSHNLYLQIMFGLGIFGLLIFLLTIFLFTQMSFEHIAKSSDQRANTTIIACITSIFSCLLFGLFDFVWYDYRMFFLFFTVIGLASACYRIYAAETRKQMVGQLYILSDK